MKRRTLLRAGLLSAVTIILVTSPTLSQVQSTAQRRCIVAMNRAFDLVARAQARVHKECVVLALNDKLAPQTLHDCLQNGPGGDLSDVQEAQAYTVAADAQYCASAMPDFGYTDAATVNAAAVIDEQQNLYGMFGPNINSAIVPRSQDPARAQCVLKVVRGIERIMKKKRIEFKRCKNGGIDSGTIISQADLEQCYVDVKLDVRQKIVKPIEWLERAVATYCAGVNLDQAFPGRCVGSSDFAQCANESTDCRMCVSQNTADDLNEDCDQYDNGVSDNSCEAVTCGNNVVEINEICDDGNTLDGDCCSSTCTFESPGSPCTDGNLCTDDTCDGSGTCVSVNNSVPCDDLLFCNGTDTCGGGSCSIHTGDPCTGNPECNDLCNEAADNCADPAATPCTDDGNVCTDDECDGLGACVHPNNSVPCDDLLFCNGTDTCNGGTCSVHSGDPCPGPDGDNDCTETCDEGADNCDGNDTDGSLCTDGLFCTATDTCSSGTCVGTVDPCPGPDGDGDCTESCNEASDNCTAADPDATACTDGLFCTQTDACSAGVCVGVGDPCPGPDGDVDCSETCNEAADDCTTNDPDGTPCTDDGDICTDDMCSLGGCAHPQNGLCMYVSPTGSGTACTQASPCSLTTGLSQVASGFEVRADQGTYTISDEITNLQSSTTLAGGYDSTNSWQQTAGCTATQISRNTSNPDGSANVDLRIVALQLSGVSNFNVECLSISTSNASGSSGMSTYGVHLTGASSYVFADVAISAGNAAPGAGGVNGSTGASGATASNGTAGLADGSSARSGGNGSAGAGTGGGALGAGASTGTGANGGDSTNARAGGGGGGGGGGGFHGTGGAGGEGGGVNGGANTTPVGTGGTGGNCSTAGGTGGSGTTGPNGSVGSAGGAGSAGSRSTFWLNGGQGGTGTDGGGARGGAAGGGGGGQDDPAHPGPAPTCLDGVGAGGGGGGGGGQGGTGGTGGRGGGSSYAVYLVTNGAGGVFNGGSRTAGTAGAGGIGGSAGGGGTGGTRGTGGSAATGVGAGGDGGFGGNGGAGGAGGNGTAGESVAVVTQSGTAPTINP